MISLFKDYKGLELCEPCFNNQHFHRGDATGKTMKRWISDCLVGGCQCPCRQLLREKLTPVRKVKMDYTNQTQLFEGPTVGQEHRDDN